MATTKEITATMARGNKKARRTRKPVAGKNSESPKPSTFEATLGALQPHLNGASITSLRMSRLASLAKKAGLREADLGVLVTSYKLAASTKLPPDALFALAKRDGGIDATRLAAANADRL